jgi:hypothetical protein
MVMYQIDTPLSRPVSYKPAREILLGINGAVLACGEPRYTCLDSYVQQFAAPISQLRGLYSFADPCWPERTILLECELEPVCERCGTVLDTCACPF